MQNTDNRNNVFDSIAIFQFIYKYKKTLLIICLSSAIGAAIFSSPLFIKPKFKSSVILYPAPSTSVSHSILDLNNSNKQDFLEFGEEAQAEQLIQILYSDAIRDEIISKYDLMNHYDIDESNPFKFTELYKEYTDNIGFRRTEYMSVEIKVMDTDPKMAADIANNIASLLDSTKNNIILESANKALRIIESQYDLKSVLIVKISDSLQFMRGKGVFDYDLQTDHLTKQQIKSVTDLNENKSLLEVYRQNGISEKDTSIIFAKARFKAAEASLRSTNASLNELKIYGGSYTSLKEQLAFENEELVKLRNRLEKAKVDASESLNTKFIVNNATPAEKKTYPVRWLIVLISTVGSFILCVVVLVSIENFKHIRNNNAA